MDCTGHGYHSSHSRRKLASADPVRDEADMLVMGFTRGDSQFSQVYRSSKPFLMRGLNAHCCNLPSQL